MSALLDKLSIEELGVLDWYDGPVTAIVRCAGDRRSSIAILLSWVDRPPDRIYGLVNVAEETALVLRTYANVPPTSVNQAPFEVINQCIHQSVAMARGELVLVRCEALAAGVVLQSVEVPLEAYRSRLTWSIDDACIRDRIELWTSVFDDTATGIEPAY